MSPCPCGPLHAGHTWRCVKGTFTGQLSGRVLREPATTGLPDAGRAPRSNSMVGFARRGRDHCWSAERNTWSRAASTALRSRLPEPAAAGRLGWVHAGSQSHDKEPRSRESPPVVLGWAQAAGHRWSAVLRWQRLDHGHHLLAQCAQRIQFPRPGQLVGGAELLGRRAGAYAGVSRIASRSMMSRSFRPRCCGLG